MRCCDSDTLGMLAHGVETYHFSENAYKKCAYHIKNIVEENNILTIVLGLPKHMNGDLGERAQISIDFKERLEKMMDVEVILEDERLKLLLRQIILFLVMFQERNVNRLLIRWQQLKFFRGILRR